MLIGNNDNDNEFLLTFADLVAIARKNMKKIFKVSLACAIAAFSLALLRTPQYEAKATFKEKARGKSGISETTALALFMMSDSNEGSALTMLKSRKINEDLVKEEGLQGIIVKDEQHFPFLPLATIKENLMAEWVTMRGLQGTVLESSQADLKAKQIDYQGEIPTKLQIDTLNQEDYHVYAADGSLLGSGRIDVPFISEHVSFTLVKNHPQELSPASYSFTLLPLHKTAEDMSKAFTILSDKNDKALVTITHKYPDRRQAALNVNKLMELYQQHVEGEHDAMSRLQIAYLTQRQAEMGQQLEQSMKLHAAELSDDLSTTGFATSEKAMEFLASSQQQLKQKLFMTTLEIQRLENAQLDHLPDSEPFSSLNNIEVFNKLASERRLLKQQADSLDLALRNLPEARKSFNDSFNEQLRGLDEIKLALKESNAILDAIDNDTLPSSPSSLFEDGRYSVKNWNDRLVETKKRLDTAPNDPEIKNDWSKCKDGYCSYLLHLVHFLNVHKRNIEERLAHQQAPTSDFQGINLNIGKELYISYNRDLSQTESQIGQQEFVLNQIHDPDFEISSLSTVLNDPVSNELIGKISGLILALKDHDNRTSKEQERIHADLAIQKGFLATHVKQTTSLLELRRHFIKEKIRQLQSINLSLIHEEISILENQAKEYVAGTLSNLKQEKQLLENNLSELRLEMAAFPQKWAAEQLITQQMEINKSLVKEIASLVESKNIGNNLEKLQSAPVDTAYPSIHPKPPRLFLLAIAGAIGGALITFLWTLGTTVVRGITPSAENLASAGMHVSGTLERSSASSLDASPPLDADLATLRRATAYLFPQNEQESSAHQPILLLEGTGPDYAPALAELLSLRGLSPLMVDIRFGDAESTGENGVLQFLEGKIQEPKIISKGNIRWIPSGGISRYANELVASPRFASLVEALRKKHHTVVFCSRAAAGSAEADSLLDIFQKVAISVAEEPMHLLRHSFARAKQTGNRITFILYEVS